MRRGRIMLSFCGNSNCETDTMNNWKVEVYYKPEVPDTIGQGILEDITDLGINGVDSVRTATVYWIEGTLDAEAIDRIGSELLAESDYPSIHLQNSKRRHDRLDTRSAIQGPVSRMQSVIVRSRASMI